MLIMPIHAAAIMPLMPITRSDAFANIIMPCAADADAMRFHYSMICADADARDALMRCRCHDATLPLPMPLSPMMPAFAADYADARLRCFDAIISIRADAADAAIDDYASAPARH